ncbi:MAG: hypothetical protein KDK37_18150 [Leptospiraceae bacterium]|nr:hypothetical protein [Leptospiraceae bacterium]
MSKQTLIVGYLLALLTLVGNCLSMHGPGGTAYSDVKLPIYATQSRYDAEVYHCAEKFLFMPYIPVPAPDGEEARKEHNSLRFTLHERLEKAGIKTITQIDLARRTRSLFPLFPYMVTRDCYVVRGLKSEQSRRTPEVRRPADSGGMVYLKDGTRIRATSIKETPAGYVITSADGIRKFYSKSEIKYIQKN